ncbi:related to oxidoreductase, short chain dehydrogenase/reductase family [Rhynchosporium agropyri]|uniref:Related to oxidoreductase, short chain dehydrogenase/reductase family n=1 Tax=Rhynchosporium agropyri TaxID=914238 RepID=A0A1E1K7M4_9HELO|nr:related to oxidoreductase, short chain dehydrogenase/reductase family [Rhynchosporium agropyri]
MLRVPVMKFCEPTGTIVAPPHQNAKARFDLTGKNAIKDYSSTSKVALLDIDEVEGNQAIAILVEEFQDRTGSIIFRVLDVTYAEQITSVTTKISEIFGDVDILATFAGIVNSSRLVDYTPENFRKVLDINTKGTFLTAQVVVKDMIAHGRGGSIILIASMAGHIVNYPQTHVAYGTCKAAVLHMRRCMAVELAVHRIRVNSISPGYMDNRLNSSPDLQDVLPIWWERTPMGRIGLREEFGPVLLLYLLAKAAIP